MTDQNMFSEQTNNKDTDDHGKSSDDNPFADKLSGILNENGEQKYKTVEDALEALAHSQQFIETLKGESHTYQEELNQLKAELDKRESVEDVVSRLTGKSQHTEKKEDQPNSGVGLDEDTARKLIEEQITALRQKDSEADNFKKVQAALVEQYGDKAREVIRTRAAELNTTPADLEKLARTNPAMALGLLGGGNVSPSKAPSTPNHSPNRQPPKQGELSRPEKSLMRGAPTEEVIDYWRQVKDHTYKKYDIDQ